MMDAQRYVIRDDPVMTTAGLAELPFLEEFTLHPFGQVSIEQEETQIVDRSDMDYPIAIHTNGVPKNTHTFLEGDEVHYPDSDEDEEKVMPDPPVSKGEGGQDLAGAFQNSTPSQAIIQESQSTNQTMALAEVTKIRSTGSRFNGMTNLTKFGLLKSVSEKEREQANFGMRTRGENSRDQASANGNTDSAESPVKQALKRKSPRQAFARDTKVTKTIADQITKETFANGKRKLYKSRPFANDPDMERSRRNAINAKRNREQKKQERARMEEAMTELRMENSMLRERNTELERKDRENTIRIAALETENQDLKERVLELEKENKDVRKRTTELERENCELKTRITAIENENQELRNKNQDLRNKNQELRLRMEQLERDNQQLRRDNHALRRENQDMRSELQEIREILRANNLKIPDVEE